MTRLLRVTAVVLAGLAAACGARGPQDIDPQADSCARCRMAIGAIVHAAEIVTADGDVRKYDSLGCLVEDHAALTRAGTRLAGAWVIEYDSHEWVPAEQAHYALAGLSTDHMGFGAVAARSRERAVVLAGGDAAKVVTWQGLNRWRPEHR